MAKESRTRAGIPDGARLVVENIARMVEDFCRAELTEEYAALGRKLTEKLARKRPSPLLGGRPEVWACGIIRVIGAVNFLADPSQTPHLPFADIDSAFGVARSTGAAKAKAIREMAKVRETDPQWILPSRYDHDPLVWMVQVDGLTLDIRQLPRTYQKIAFEKGLIPYIPADRQPALPPLDAGPSPALSAASAERAAHPHDLLAGRWQIQSIKTRDGDFIQATTADYFEFSGTNGEFHFGNIHGHMHTHPGTRDGQPAFEWTWDGNNDMAAAHGSGWAVVKGRELHGTLRFPGGVESDFIAVRVS